MRKMSEKRMKIGAEIHKRHQSGDTYVDIGKYYDVSGQRVKKIEDNYIRESFRIASQLIQDIQTSAFVQTSRGGKSIFLRNKLLNRVKEFNNG